MGFDAGDARLLAVAFNVLTMASITSLMVIADAWAPSVNQYTWATSVRACCLCYFLGVCEVCH